jgi:hypothetical protein
MFPAGTGQGKRKNGIGNVGNTEPIPLFYWHWVSAFMGQKDLLKVTLVYATIFA